MYLPARFSWVPRGPPKSRGSLHASVTKNTLDALSTRKPRLAWFTLEEEEVGEKESDKLIVKVHFFHVMQ